MRAAVLTDTVDLWEAWIDLQGATGSQTLYVVGDVCTCSKTVPVLLKKHVQGTTASHLVLEVMPCLKPGQGRLAEVGYAEPVFHLDQYQQISICDGEEIIARINTIEVIA